MTAISAQIAPISAATQSVEPGNHATLAVLLPQWLRRIVWLGVILVFFLNALLATIFALLYVAGLIIRDGAMIETSGLIGLSSIPIIIAAYAAVAGYFFMHLGHTLSTSIRQRRLAFFASNHTASLAKKQAHPSRWVALQLWRRWRLRVDAWRTRVVDSTPAMFELVFLSRESVEVATQTYQVYKCSTLISQRWINDFYVAVLTTNCWIAPLIHVAARRDAAAQRFLFLWSDTTLDLVSTLVIPVFIIYSSLLGAMQDNLQSERTDAEYAFDAPYNDTFLINIFKGVQQVCVVSWWDFLTKMLPFISMANCLHYIRRMVEPVGASHSAHAVPKPNQIAVASAEATRPPESIKTGKLSSKKRWTRLDAFTHMIYALFVVWGATIVGLHLQSEAVADATPLEHKTGCKSSSAPWFVSKFSCTVMEINCYRRQLTGTADEIDQALGNVDANGVSSLIISHCPSLYIPQRLQTLKNMMGFEIVNSTIVRWDEDAALTKTSTPSMLFATLTRVNVTELPRGLQSADFPPHLTDVSISVSNLTSLPPELNTKWAPVISLVLERTQLSTVPSCIGKLRLFRLSLLGNLVTSISDDLMADMSRLSVVSVAKNPITQFPAVNAESAQSMNMILLDYTLITALPGWALTEGQRRVAAKAAPLTVSAGGSSFCESGGGDGTAPPGITIVCRLKTDEAIQGYPLAFNVAHRVP